MPEPESEPEPGSASESEDRPSPSERRLGEGDDVSLIAKQCLAEQPAAGEDWPASGDRRETPSSARATIPALPVTEQENPRTREISSLPAGDIVRLINEEDARVASAVERTLPEVTRAVEEIVARLQNGGRLIHVGTGTSGRLGVLDASECPPTFGVSPELVQGLIAGGYEACYRAVEASEDDRAAGARDLDARGVSARDAVVGIAASGRTPYTIGAVAHARALGAFTVAVTCVPDSEITRAAEVPIVAVVGPEVLAGSTRMKAGTAQKMILNMLSTATMIRLGYVTGNRMTNMRARNSKLLARSIRIVCAETGVDEAAAQTALARAGDDLPCAIVMLKTGRAPDEARAALAAARGIIASAVSALQHREADRSEPA
jgi:N-acetylmuramic acid 6-phosphate etherase